MEFFGYKSFDDRFIPPTESMIMLKKLVESRVETNIYAKNSIHWRTNFITRVRAASDLLVKNFN